MRTDDDVQQQLTPDAFIKVSNSLRVSLDVLITRMHRLHHEYCQSQPAKEFLTATHFFDALTPEMTADLARAAASHIEVKEAESRTESPTRSSKICTTNAAVTANLIQPLIASDNTQQRFYCLLNTQLIGIEQGESGDDLVAFFELCENDLDTFQDYLLAAVNQHNALVDDLARLPLFAQGDALYTYYFTLSQRIEHTILATTKYIETIVAATIAMLQDRLQQLRHQMHCTAKNPAELQTAVTEQKAFNTAISAHKETIKKANKNIEKDIATIQLGMDLGCALRYPKPAEALENLTRDLKTLQIHLQTQQAGQILTKKAWKTCISLIKTALRILALNKTTAPLARFQQDLLQQLDQVKHYLGEINGYRSIPPAQLIATHKALRRFLKKEVPLQLNPIREYSDQKLMSLNASYVSADNQRHLIGVIAHHLCNHEDRHIAAALTADNDFRLATVTDENSRYINKINRGRSQDIIFGIPGEGGMPGVPGCEQYIDRIKQTLPVTAFRANSFLGRVWHTINKVDAYRGIDREELDKIIDDLNKMINDDASLDGNYAKLTEKLEKLRVLLTPPTFDTLIASESNAACIGDYCQWLKHQMKVGQALSPTARANTQILRLSLPMTIISQLHSLAGVLRNPFYQNPMRETAAQDFEQKKIATLRTGRAYSMADFMSTNKKYSGATIVSDLSVTLENTARTYSDALLFAEIWRDFEEMYSQLQNVDSATASTSDISGRMLDTLFTPMRLFAEALPRGRHGKVTRAGASSSAPSSPAQGTATVASATVKVSADDSSSSDDNSDSANHPTLQTTSAEIVFAILSEFRDKIAAIAPDIMAEHCPSKASGLFSRFTQRRN